jgi:signal transduction histidine kinase
MDEALPLALTTDVVVLAPTGRDALLAQRLLEAVELRVKVCPDIGALCDAITERSGVLLIAEEALHRAGREKLLAALASQPTWSDIPIIILTGEGELSRAIPEALQTLAARANVTLLERPVRVATLTTAVRSALRARTRQLDVREFLLERFQSEQDLLQARQEAEAANQAKSNFLTTMSHELRTPLNAIAGYTELLMLELAGPINTKQREQLQRIERSERHLLSLINDVLNFARIEAGEVKLNVRRVDVAETVRDLESFIAPQLRAKSLSYREEIADEPLTTMSDGEKIRQILLNLLSNAVKFTPEDGRITVKARREGNHICVTVLDNGEGISPDKVEDIFEPFVQVDRTFKSPAEGTGLGLSISRDLAQRLGGDLTCISKVGEGSAFTLRLPKR